MMDAAERAQLAELMQRMAAGDTIAVFLFVDAFRGRLAGAVRRVVAPFGRRDVLQDPATLEALVQSAALVIFDHAAAWDPDGALPWTWAERAIRAEVVAWLGPPSVALTAALTDELTGALTGDPTGDRAGVPRSIERATVFVLDGAAEPADVTAPDLVVLRADDGGDELQRLARREPVVALLWTAIGAVASPRDRRVHIQYRLQKGMGDRSPAHTVAAEFGLQPDNVRQIDHRVRRKVRALIERDEVFAPLRDLYWLAA